MTFNEFNRRMSENKWWWEDANCQQDAFEIFERLFKWFDAEESFQITSDLLALGTSEFGN